MTVLLAAQTPPAVELPLPPKYRVKSNTAVPFSVALAGPWKRAARSGLPMPITVNKKAIFPLLSAHTTPVPIATESVTGGSSFKGLSESSAMGTLATTLPPASPSGVSAVPTIKETLPALMESMCAGEMSNQVPLRYQPDV